MTFINPLAVAAAAQPSAQRAAESEKVRQARREQALAKNVAAEDDRLEHQVESGDAVQPADPNGGRPNRQPRRQRPRPKLQTGLPDDGAEPPHIDVKA
jgi:hypothetical protein